METQHAVKVLRNNQTLPWDKNTINIGGPNSNYGFGCIDGFVMALKIEGDQVYLSAVDFGAHLTRHIYNSLRSLWNKKEKEIGSLESAVKSGRDYDFKSPLFMPVNGQELYFAQYYELTLKLILENIRNGFFQMNYWRPLCLPTSERIDGKDSDFAISGQIYKFDLTLMPIFWPALLNSRHPSFSGANVWLSSKEINRAPAPFTSFISFKAASAYHPSRNPAVFERDQFNLLFRDRLVLHDALIRTFDGDKISEGTGSNLHVILPNGTIITDPNDGTTFPGLTQDFVHRIVNSEIGKLFGWKMERRYISESELTALSQKGAELFLTGSACGIVPISKIITTKNGEPPSSSDLADYTIYEFEPGPKTQTQIIADCYRCFSLGDDALVSKSGRMICGTGKMEGFSTWPLLIEVPENLRAAAVEVFTNFNPKLGQLKSPPDQIMRSELVKPLRAREVRKLNF